MGIEVVPDAYVVRVLQKVQEVLYFLAITGAGHAVVLLLVLVVLPLSVFASKSHRFWLRLKPINIVAFKVVKYIYRPLKTDYTGGVPRFIIMGYLTPVYYTYQLLGFTLVMVPYVLYSFWTVTFLSSAQTTECTVNRTLEANATQCIVLSLRVIQGASSSVSLVAAIVFVHLFVLEIFLKFSGGKATFDKLLLGDCNIINRMRWVLIAVLMFCQFVWLVGGKFAFFVYFYITDNSKGTSVNLFDEQGWFTISLLIDDIAFVLITPWFTFEKIKKKKKGNKENGKEETTGSLEAEEEVVTSLVGSGQDEKVVTSFVGPGQEEEVVTSLVGPGQVESVV